jgi:hypothetical protein
MPNNNPWNPWKDEWNGHKWVEPNGRHLHLVQGGLGVQWRGHSCAREFLIIETSGEPLAVHSLITRFSRLTDDVTKRWIEQPCPGERLALDDQDRKKGMAEIPVSGNATRS